MAAALGTAWPPLRPPEPAARLVLQAQGFPRRMAAIARLAAATLWSRRRLLEVDRGDALAASGGAHVSTRSASESWTVPDPSSWKAVSCSKTPSESGVFFQPRPTKGAYLPGRAQRAISRLAEPDLVELVTGAVVALGADRVERTLRPVSGLARNGGCRRPGGGQFGCGC